MLKNVWTIYEKVLEKSEEKIEKICQALSIDLHPKWKENLNKDPEILISVNKIIATINKISILWISGFQ